MSFTNSPTFSSERIREREWERYRISGSRQRFQHGEIKRVPLEHGIEVQVEAPAAWAPQTVREIEANQTIEQ